VVRGRTTGSFFTSADNVTVADPQEYMADFAELEKRAARYADGNHWRQY
jgi:hypothetical protein